MKHTIRNMLILTAALTLFSCDSVKRESRRALFNEVMLNWETNTFEVDGFVIEIPEKWGAGIEGVRDKFKEYDPHDISFHYVVTTTTAASGVTTQTASFAALKLNSPNEDSKIFEIPTVGLDLSKQRIEKDEWVNDYYFRYDFNPEYYNRCYFKISKTSYDKLGNGYFNQINVKMKYLVHIDKAKSFKVHATDGLNEVGYYSDVSIVNNPLFE